MAKDFVAIDRGQLLLMPPSLVEWLPEDHLVWTILGAVDQMDLGRFSEAYRLGAAGRAPYDRRMMVALLMYSYARGNRSSRGIERACWEDVAFKVITSMRTPDHSRIAEFRRRHEPEIAELFDDVLALCCEAGLVSVGAITIDGTKIKADASMDQNRSYRDLVTQILREAEEIDQAEDRLHGKDRRGDELPEELRTPEGRRQALAEAKRRLEERKGRPIKECATADPEMDLEPLVLGRQVLRRGGRREWPRVARRELEAHRAQLLADAGYWHTRQIQAIQTRGMEVLVPPDGTMRDGIRPGWEHGFFDVMRQRLLTDRGRQLYAKRKISVEPVYGQIKHNRRIDRFMRRGRAAAQSEWRLIAATHNLLKLHSHWIANTA
jgi:transposase